MIPDNELSTEVVRSSFIAPDAAITGPLEDFERGGIALQDPSEGLEYQIWRGYWNPEDSTAYLIPLKTALPPVPIFTLAGVTEFTFAFDQNMRWCAAVILDSGVCQLRWFDTNVQAYVTSTYSDIVSIKLCLDDKRRVPTFSNITDVLFTYIKNNNKLYIRNQRQRFLVEHLLYEDLPENRRISNFGMNKGWRMQWRLMTRTWAA